MISPTVVREKGYPLHKWVAGIDDFVTGNGDGDLFLGPLKKASHVLEGSRIGGTHEVGLV